MVFRDLKRANLKVSEIGIGCEHLQGKSFDVVKSVVDFAIDHDINIFDVFMSEPDVRSNIGIALENRRDKVIIQGHIGSIWQDGQYCKSRNFDECRYFFEDLLFRLKTNYIDIGMIHYVDTADDFKKVFNGELIEYAKILKEKGIIKAIGISSHNPIVAKMAVDTGLIDVLMFSINPAYDILPEHTDIMDMFTSKVFENENLKGMNNAREELYKTCEAMNVAITVMKTLAAGTLLKKETSPFKIALTETQCINYALNRPAVASVLIGCANSSEIEEALKFEKASDKEKDYSEILSTTSKFSMRGRCMYCNHCLPCPSKIDIALVNKFLDLSKLQDSVPETVRNHYLDMENHASDCIACGSCEENCPFSVKIIERMNEAKEVFGL